MVAPSPPGAVPPDGHAIPRFSRRALLRRGGRGAAALFAGAALLAACDRGGETPPGAVGRSTVADWEEWWGHQRQTGRLHFANWPYYIDMARGNRHPSLDVFSEETDIHVRYFHPIQDNASFLESIEPYLEAGLPTFYDLIVMTNGPQVNKLIRSDWLTPLDQSRLVNFNQYASDLVRDPSWDPGNQYSIAWQSGLTGIAYRPEAVRAIGHEPTSIHDLFHPALKDRVGMMSDVLDLGSAGLLAVGVDPATSTERDWVRAADALRAQRGEGMVRSYYEQSYIGALSRGDIWIGQAWSGDVFQTQQLGRVDLQFVVPEEGAMLWTDSMMIPRNSRHPLDALTYMDFVYRPDVAAMIADWVWYICPVPAAQRIIAERLGHPEVAESPLIFPTAESLAPTGLLKSYRIFESEEDAGAWQSIFGSIPFGL